MPEEFDPFEFKSRLYGRPPPTGVLMVSHLVRNTDSSLEWINVRNVVDSFGIDASVVDIESATDSMSAFIASNDDCESVETVIDDPEGFRFVTLLQNAKSRVIVGQVRSQFGAYSLFGVAPALIGQRPSFVLSDDWRSTRWETFIYEFELAGTSIWDFSAA